MGPATRGARAGGFEVWRATRVSAVPSGERGGETVIEQARGGSSRASRGQSRRAAGAAEGAAARGGVTARPAVRTQRLSVAHDVEPPPGPPRATGTRRVRLADEPSSPAPDAVGGPESAFVAEALARRDARAWQDALVLAPPPRRTGADDAGLLLLLLVLALGAWRFTATPPAPVDVRAAASSAPRSGPGEVEQAVAPVTRPDAASPHGVLAAGGLAALAAAGFALLRTQAGAGLAFAGAAALAALLIGRPPDAPTAALTLATVGFVLVASRGAALAWEVGASAALVAVASVTTPTVGAALLGAWAVEAAVAARGPAALARGALASPLLLRRRAHRLGRRRGACSARRACLAAPCCSSPRRAPSCSARAARGWRAWRPCYSSSPARPGLAGAREPLPRARRRGRARRGRARPAGPRPRRSGRREAARPVLNGRDQPFRRRVGVERRAGGRGAAAGGVRASFTRRR
ncbi:MAG: hypothetical protein KF878_06765 [Planctomycetes bacterium]|nr:hypothetical protein [Planctomycetota bacterium]